MSPGTQNQKRNMETLKRNPPELHRNVRDDEEASIMTEHEDTSLPFALATEGEPHDRLKPFTEELPSSPCTPTKTLQKKIGEESYFGSGVSSSCSQQLPTLALSVVSTPTTCTATDGENSFGSDYGERNYTSASLIQANSQELDVAASLLLPNSSLVMNNMNSQTSASRSIITDNQETATKTEVTGGFSELLNQADDRNEVPASSPIAPTKISSRLPVLPEEVSSSPVQGTETKHLLPDRSDLAPQSPPQLVPRLEMPSHHDSSTRTDGSSLSFLQQTIVAAAPTIDTTTLPCERRMASLAGATARRTSNTSFHVSVDLSSSSNLGSALQQQQDVMDILGNPDLLRLWCDSVPALVITSSSEGARNAVNWRSPSNLESSPDRDRQYAGEWIEATTNQLSPPKHTTCLYYTARAIKSSLGFPSYGKVVMFVERQRGQVGLTIGPFPGGVNVMHKIVVEPVSERRVRISDQVQLRHADDGDVSSFCGTWPILSRLLYPQLEDYIDQVLSSMARLRFLIENGDSSAGYVAPPASSPDGNALSTPLLDAIPPV